MTPVRSVRSRYSGYQPRNALGGGSSAYDSGEAAAFDYLNSLGIGDGGAAMGGMNALGTAYAASPQPSYGWPGGYVQDSPMGRDPSSPSINDPMAFDIEGLTDQQLTSYYQGQTNLVRGMNTPGGWLARGLAGIIPGVGTAFGLAQKPILMAYQNEMAKRGLLANAFQAPASGDWTGLDARAFDMGWYGYGDTALNVDGARFAGQSTATPGGNPATTGNFLSNPQLPDFTSPSLGLDNVGGGSGVEGGGFNTGSDWGPDHGSLY